MAPLAATTAGKGGAGQQRRWQQQQGSGKSASTRSPGPTAPKQRQQQDRPLSSPSAAEAQPLRAPSYPVPEVLAPAGGREQFLAALNSGADAVFLGLRAFNARARAENFDIEDLRELVPLAHRYGMKVLVTVNVLIKEGELPDLVETLSALEELEVDAAIVQDQAVGALARRFFPRLRLHASTQMAVHNLQGVERAASLGYRRVVLARELTAKEMGDIRAGVSPKVAELEAFVHGSLCYSYSGLCFFSGEKDARSGNRGECSYACRQPFQITSEDGLGMLFSMLDLDLSHPTDLNLLASAGVDTLKIEGRKKDAAYVSSAVQLYRRQLDRLYQRPTLRPQAPPEARAAVGAAALRDEAELRRDLSLSFHRGTTSFFTRSRYHENVIDLGNAGHNGVRAGKVEAVSKDGRSFRFRPQVDLEKYDGLKVVPPERAFHTVPQHGALDAADETGGDGGGSGSAPGGLGRLMDKYDNVLPEFSLRSFRLAGAKGKVFEAPAGAVVEVDLPSEVQTQRGIRIGDWVYQARSAELKRRVTALAAVPEEYKARAWRTVEVEVDVEEERGAAGQEGRVTLSVSVRKLGEEIAREEAVLPWEAARREGWTRVDAVQELAELFGVFGDAGFRVGADGAVAVRGLVAADDDTKEVPYLPRKELKALKQCLVAKLPGAYDALVAGRRAAALASLEEGTAARPPAGWADRRFAIKVDRPEYLELLDAYLSSSPSTEGLVEEVVFEPKRAFLADTGPEEGTRRLLELAQKHGLRARLALPTVNRAWDLPPLRGWVQAFAEAAMATDAPARFEVGNLGAWGLLEEIGLGAANPRVDLATDFPLYALNHEATAVWARELRPSRMTLSVEDDADNLRAQLQRWPTAAADGLVEPQYILYKDVPLFLAESCSLTALHGGCPGSKVCGYRTLSIENDSGEQFEVAHEHCKTVVYGKDAQSLVHRQGDLLAMGVRHFRLDFLTRPYDAVGVTRVMDAALRREATDRRPLPETHVANFDRRLL